MTPAFLESALLKHGLLTSIEFGHLPYGRVDVRVSLPWIQCLTEAQRERARTTVANLLTRMGEPQRFGVIISRAGVPWAMTRDIAAVLAVVAMVWMVWR